MIHDRSTDGVLGEVVNYLGKRALKDIGNIFTYPVKRFDNKLFVLNSGGCASNYLTEILRENGVSKVYHNKSPTLDYSGVKEYLGEGSFASYIILGLSRVSVNVEISHDIFSFSRQIKVIYPESKFVHLHRGGIDSVRSIVNKVLFPEIFNKSTRIRYRSRLSGKKELDPFSRACSYWANINRRIIEDLEEIDDADTTQLRFRDLIEGNLGCVEEFLGRSLPVKTIEPVRTKDHLKNESAVTLGEFSNWPAEWKRAFARICGPVHERLGYEMPDVDL